ncbi:hypothetical protein OGAPHI_004724 [Ogataea philodendri]|uniref:Uncharacterized protein n=1 Tax=Ogataea philodendri TaxID=1378263 RepID=A0A9P8T3H6_9ASCO|nr:uncharacterized protein OGAPHI_004724 [Ogataea philodendri]KAH3664010.1 hypothetical protein OGAPHI_004724 [Ogataea philodendri]
MYIVSHVNFRDPPLTNSRIFQPSVSGLSTSSGTRVITRAYVESMMSSSVPATTSPVLARLNRLISWTRALITNTGIWLGSSILDETISTFLTSKMRPSEKMPWSLNCFCCAARMLAGASESHSLSVFSSPVMYASKTSGTMYSLSCLVRASVLKFGSSSLNALITLAPSVSAKKLPILSITVLIRTSNGFSASSHFSLNITSILPIAEFGLILILSLMLLSDLMLVATSAVPASSSLLMAFGLFSSSLSRRKRLCSLVSYKPYLEAPSSRVWLTSWYVFVFRIGSITWSTVSAVFSTVVLTPLPTGDSQALCATSPTTWAVFSTPLAIAPEDFCAALYASLARLNASLSPISSVADLSCLIWSESSLLFFHSLRNVSTKTCIGDFCPAQRAPPLENARIPTLGPRTTDVLYKMRPASMVVQVMEKFDIFFVSVICLCKLV